MSKFSELDEYNTQTFNELRGKFTHFQLGFFNGNTILFVGQNPGQPFDSETRAATDRVLDKTEFQSFEAEYEKLIQDSVIGRYLAPMIEYDWSKVSFTNTVKVATENNEQPDSELYEFFFPILMKQIDLLKPTLIACLGKYAGSVFALDKFYDARRYNESIVCMYPHPSYIMRQGQSAVVNEQAKMQVSIEELLGLSYAAHQSHAQSLQREN